MVLIDQANYACLGCEGNGVLAKHHLLHFVIKRESSESSPFACCDSEKEKEDLQRAPTTHFNYDEETESCERPFTYMSRERVLRKTQRTRRELCETAHTARSNYVGEDRMKETGVC